MVQIALKTYKILQRPMSDYLAWTLFYFLLLWSQDLLTTEYCSWKSFIARPAWFGLYDAWMAYIFGLIPVLFSRWKVVYRVVRSLITLPIGLFCIGSLFLHFRLGQSWNGNTITVLLATNVNEISDFVTSYLCSFQTLVWVVVLPAVTGAYFKGMHRLQHIQLPNGLRIAATWLRGGIACTVLLLTCYWGPSYGFDLERNSDYADRLLFRPQFYQAFQSAVAISMNGQYTDQCLIAQQNLDATCEEPDSCHLVLVIGESFIKRHSSLYGYPLCTNPRLAQADSLLCFDDVTSTSNLTYLAFTNMMSMASVDDSLQWYNTPLFPALFRKAGYHVIFYSNQFSRAQGFDIVRATTGFIDRDDIARCCFDYQNDRIFDNDVPFMEEYNQKCLSHEEGRLRLTIVHLNGQHFAFNKRFPADRAYFTASDIVRTDLDEAQKQEVADYDNATLFNDSIVAGILSRYQNENMVMIYLSDHG